MWQLPAALHLSQNVISLTCNTRLYKSENIIHITLHHIYRPIFYITQQEEWHKLALGRNHIQTHTQHNRRNCPTLWHNIAHRRNHIQTHTQHSSKNCPTLWLNIAHRRNHIQTQHSRKNGPSLWDTLVHRRDHIQTHNRTGGTARHYGIH
jgi:hypothetical protein